MPTAETRYEHVVLNDSKVPILAGTTTKVIELVVEKLAYGWSPEELHFQHPHLSMGQICSALAYYWDNQQEFEREIEEQLETLDRFQSQTPSPPFLSRLRADKHS